MNLNTSRSVRKVTIYSKQQYSYSRQEKEFSSFLSRPAWVCNPSGLLPNRIPALLIEVERAVKPSVHYTIISISSSNRVCGATNQVN